MAKKKVQSEPKSEIKDKVKIITVMTINPRRIYLCGQAMEFLKNETRVLRSDKIPFLEDIVKKLTSSDPPVIKIIEVKEE